MFQGAKFHSSQEFQQKLKEFEDENKCSFVFKNSTKSMTDNKSRKRPIDETKFELARGTMVCAHYGTKRLTASKGIKTSTMSQKLQCEAMFSFKYDEWEPCLFIHKCNLKHNHVLDSRLFSQQHKQKKFSLQEKAVLKFEQPDSSMCKQESEPDNALQESPNEDVTFAVDQLIDFIMTSKWSLADMHAIRRRHWMNIQPKPEEKLYKQYLDLYQRLVLPVAMETLPVPENWIQL